MFGAGAQFWLLLLFCLNVYVGFFTRLVGCARWVWF